jgi:hypothetical protein
MIGASNGGNVSLYIGMKHPEQFGKIAAQSSNVISAIGNTFANGPKLNLELYLDIGNYDIAELIPLVHNLRDILHTKNYLYQFFEWPEGHSWGNWSGHLRYPLIQFFSAPGGINEQPPMQDIRLEPNRPNPFWGQTTIPFFAPPGSHAELTLNDSSGRKLQTLFSATIYESHNEIIFNNQSYKPGNYICRLLVNRFQASRIITIRK